MTTNAPTRTRTTAADIAAAVALGAIDGSAEYTDGAAIAAPPEGSPESASALSADTHECGIAGCRHGADHPAKSQPDRQVKLQCPVCGAIARMTASALASTLGITCIRDSATFVPAAHRQYNRKSA